MSKQAIKVENILTNKSDLSSGCCLYTVAQKPTYDPQMVVFADRRLDLRVVLHSGHTLQVAVVVQSDDQGEDCNLPIQGGVHSQSLVPVPLPARPYSIRKNSTSTAMNYNSLE